MAKKATKTATKAPRKRVARVKNILPVTEPAKDFDFTTARELEGRDIIKSSVITGFYVTNSKGEEVVFHCHKDYIPPTARVALGW